MSNDNVNEHEKLISKKATFHKNCFVHIKLNSQRGWENGWIEEVEADFLILKLTEQGALKNGSDKLSLFFLEIRDIQEYEVKE